MTCWRRLEEWNRAGVWQRLHEVLLAELQAAGKLDWSPRRDRPLACAGRQTRPKSGPSPVDRARPGSKHHILTEGAGIPLAVSLTGGNRHDVTQLLPLIDKIRPVRGGVAGRPRQRPDQLFADRAYDHDKYRKAVRGKGIRPRIARRGQPHGSGLGAFRWVVERTVAWYHGMKRLRIRWERRDDIHEAFLGLATCIITYRHVVPLY
ncbi:IS5 family transposase [Micromonospora sp. L5]|uniref:IS5 family transposase n=1 Tax=Micromonospora TaxID=1873 RepID=UPI0001C45C8C|nr:IS5 family transposase [Micromonospora sp. L5]